MKIKFIIVIPLLLALNASASVDFGATWVAPSAYGPACLGNQYVQVGFFTNWEVNNASFQIQRSQDPGFSWWITSTPGFNGNLSGCGTCGNSSFNVYDYGPFNAGEVWYYRVRATSNWGVHQHKDLGTYTCTSPTIVNWISQVTSSVTTGSSPSTEGSYTWAPDARKGQGVTINLIPSEINKIYLEQNNNKINFSLNPINSFSNLDVNIDNGGYYNLYNGGLTTSYIWQNSASAISSMGNHNLKVRYTDLGGTIYYREYDVYVVPESDALYLDNYCNTMRVWKGNDPANGTPLILSEGFDAYNTKSEQYYREAGKDLINCLLNKGFNIYVINYSLNAQSIKNNAAIFQSAIRYISSINGNRKVVATGMSMGGVINRYACAKAENDGNPLPISKFVTLDAPHQGAYISESLQEFVKQTNSDNGDSYSDYASNNDAAKELLKHHEFDPGSGIHTSFFNTLNSLNGDGYPHLVPSIGVAFSTNAMNPAPHGANWLKIKIHTPVKPDEYFYLELDEKLPGSFLPELNKDPFIAGPNKFWWLNGTILMYPFLYPRVDFIQYYYPSFISHNSALDIVSGVSKFDKTIVPAATGFHDDVPPDIIEPLVNALLEDNVYIQNKNYNYQRLIAASEHLHAGNNVNPSEAAGDVNVQTGAIIDLRAGISIELANGLNVDNGAEFSAVIEPVHCDGSIVFQNRSLPVSLDEQEPMVIYDTETIKNMEVIPMSMELGIYPNPTDGMINVRNPLMAELKFAVFTVQGDLVLSGDLKGENTVDLQAMNPGIYLLQLIDQGTGEMKQFRIVKM